MSIKAIPKAGNVTIGGSKPKVADYSGVLTNDKEAFSVGPSKAPQVAAFAPVQADIYTQVKKDGAEATHDHKVETIAPGAFSSTGMKVSISLGRTIATAPYENIKIDVSLTVPCDPENLGEAYEFGSEWVSQRLAEAEKAAKGLA